MTGMVSGRGWMRVSQPNPTYAPRLVLCLSALAQKAGEWRRPLWAGCQRPCRRAYGSVSRPPRSRRRRQGVAGHPGRCNGVGNRAPSGGFGAEMRSALTRPGDVAAADQIEEAPRLPLGAGLELGDGQPPRGQDRPDMSVLKHRLDRQDEAGRVQDEGAGAGNSGRQPGPAPRWWWMTLRRLDR